MSLCAWIVGSMERYHSRLLTSREEVLDLAKLVRKDLAIVVDVGVLWHLETALGI